MTTLFAPWSRDFLEFRNFRLFMSAQATYKYFQFVFEQWFLTVLIQRGLITAHLSNEQHEPYKIGKVQRKCLELKKLLNIDIQYDEQ